ncbi:hypothetical protein J437_LFUL013085 [Ladona fulva]|uniref:Uncharacterized protein n=1 Tax=Ladona fulva TaxID=123851 RepID=A0A8K0KG56_LADFU|nr:hypothetical protein J437_LFUL013085 [Ladona fulva]
MPDARRCVETRIWNKREIQDSILDMLTGLGAPPTKLIISLPTHGLSFTLKNENENVARSPVAGAPKVINYEQGKYSLLRGLGGVAISTIDADDQSGACGRGPFPLTRVLKDTLTKLSRKPRGLILQSLEEELRGGVSVALPEASLDSSVRLSPFRIVRVVDREGNVHVTRRDAETRFHCSRQGYFMHPLGCNMFYRCVKFDQLSNDFSVYEYDCGPGLVFDEKWEVCVHPSQRSGPCHGSSEIQPVPRAKFTCPAEGYYADPENCRWFFACLDHHGDPSVAGRDATDPHSGLTAYEFRCPFGLAFDGTRLACEWPWIVPGCGKVEIGSGVLAAIQPTGYSVSGVGGIIGSVGIGALHHTSHHIESGSVASVVGVADKGAGFVDGGGSQIRLGESGSVASIFSAGDAGHVASGGAKIDLGGVRFGTGHAGLDSSYVSHGPGFVTGRVGIVSQGVELVSQGQNLVSSGPGLVSGSGGLLSGSGGLLSGAHGVVSSGAQLASGGAQLLSEGVQVLTGGGQILSGGARISNVRPVSGVESGSVASIFEISKAGEGTFSSGAEHTGLGGVGVAIDESHVASGGSLYSSGGSRGSFISSGSVRGSSFSNGGGRTSYYTSGGLRESQYHGGSSRGAIVSSEGADSTGSVQVTPGVFAVTSEGLRGSVGGAEVSSGVAHSISSGEKILNVQSYQTPAVKFETSAPAVGVSYTSRSSIPTGGISFNLGHSIAAGGNSFTTGSSVVAGAEGGVSRNQAKPLEIVGVTSGGIGQVDNIHLSVEGVEANGGEVNGIGLSGVGVSGVGVGGASVGRFGIGGVQVSGDGVSGVRGIGSGLGLQSITTVAPTLVEVNRGVPFAPVIHSNYDNSPKYTVSISTPSSTSRAIPVVTPSVQLVTPAPIQFQSPQPAFLAHETYHSSAPATFGSGSNSFSTGSLSDGSEDFSLHQPGSRAGATGSGRSHYSFRQRVDHQSRSNQPQYYHSPSGVLGVSSYSIDSSAQRTGGFVPIKPLVSSNIFTASESPSVTLTNSPAFEATRVSSIGGPEGGSVVNALPQESLSSPNKEVLVDNSQDGIGFGLVRDDGHTVTGDGASRPSLVGVQRDYQEQLRSSVTAPETEFSYKELPLSIYQAAPPARTFDVSGVGTAFRQAPKRLFSTINVTPAPALKLAVNAVHPSTFITPSTTPAYEEVNEDISRQLGNKEFSYKNIFPVVELSTPAPKVVDIPQVSIRNQLNFEKNIYNPVFTSTVSPPTSIGIDDGDYGSRIVYTNNAKQPAAFTSSHGNSGLRHFVQTESPAISYSPAFTQTTPIQHTQSVPVTPATTVFVSTTPAPLSTLSYSKLPSTPIAPASPIYYIPQRGSSRQRYFSTTTASPILAEAFPGEEDSHQEVQFFEPNRVTQNIPITSTYGPPIGSLSLIPALNDSTFGGRAIPAFKQSTFRGYGALSIGDSDNEGPINLPAGVQGSYEDVLLKQAQVNDDDESQVPVIIDSINAGRGHYRYRGRNGRVRINGKKKCDDDENRDEADVNADAILDSFSGNYGSILDNGQRDALVQGIISEDLREKTSGSLNDYQGLNNAGLSVGVTVKSSLDNGELGRSRSRPRGRYQGENVNYHFNFKSSTAQPAEYTSGVRNTYTVSTVPTVVPIVSSTIGYVSEGDYQTSGRNFASGIGDLQSEINSKYSGGLSEGLSNLGSSRRLSQGVQRGGLRVNSGIQLKSSNQRAELYSESSRKSSESSSGIDHAAVIVLPCGKLPALLAKLGAVTEALRSIQEEETSSTLKVTQERSRASLSLPPVDRYRNGDWNQIEKSLGNDMCKRAGLFRHPQDCNRFYECYWDEWKGRYSLHEFKCPIRLAYDDSLSACNWPTSGPACSANKLLV